MRETYQRRSTARHSTDEYQRHVTVVRIGTVLRVVRILNGLTGHHGRSLGAAATAGQPHYDDKSDDNYDRVGQAAFETHSLHGGVVNHRLLSRTRRWSGGGSSEARSE